MWFMPRFPKPAPLLPKRSWGFRYVPLHLDTIHLLNIWNLLSVVGRLPGVPSWSNRVKRKLYRSRIHEVSLPDLKNAGSYGKI